jgi:hypothetical protein
MSYCDALMWKSPQGASSESAAVERERARTAYVVRATPASRSGLFADLAELAAEHTHELLGDTLLKAREFAVALPHGVDEPELALDRDRDIAFDWINEQNDMVSVRVAATGRLVYAANVGGQRASGTVQFTGNIPAPLLEVLHRLSQAAG